MPEEIAFATKPQQALAMVTDALQAGLKARWFAGDEVYCGRELRRGIRALGLRLHRWHRPPPTRSSTGTRTP